MKVVVTGGHYPAALAAARSLKRAGLRTVTVAAKRASYVRFSRASAETHLAPDVSESASAFVEAVAAACGPEEPTVLVPGTEPELFALVHWRHLLPDWVLGLPTPDVLDNVTDKGRLNALALEAGVAIPKTRILRPGDSAAGIALPAVVKPVRTATVVGDAVVSASPVAVAREDELVAAVEGYAGEAAVVQPLLEGDLYALSGVMWEGALLAPMQQVALSVFPWPCGGSALARTTPVDEPLLAGVTAMLRASRWRGVVQVQWIGSADGAALIDVNPRIYGSLALANAAGSPLAAIWACLLLGLEWQPEPACGDVLYRNLETFTRAHPTPAAARFPHRARRSTSSVFEASDPLPLLASLARGGGKLRKDLRSRAARRPPEDAVLRVDDDDVAGPVEGVGPGGADGASVDPGDGVLSVRRRR